MLLYISVLEKHNKGKNTKTQTQTFLPLFVRIAKRQSKVKGKHARNNNIAMKHKKHEKAKIGIYVLPCGRLHSHPLELIIIFLLLNSPPLTLKWNAQPYFMLL